MRTSGWNCPEPKVWFSPRVGLGLGLNCLFSFHFLISNKRVKRYTSLHSPLLLFANPPLLFSSLSFLSSLLFSSLFHFPPFFAFLPFPFLPSLLFFSFPFFRLHSSYRYAFIRGRPYSIVLDRRRQREQGKVCEWRGEAEEDRREERSTQRRRAEREVTY